MVRRVHDLHLPVLGRVVAGSLGGLTALFAPSVLDQARRRWGRPCALYAVDLRDPLGGAIFETMKEIGCAPRALRKFAEIDGSPVAACVAPLADLIGALRGLADAERWAIHGAATPLMPESARLLRALVETTRTGRVAVLCVAAGWSEVLPLEQAAPHVGNPLLASPPPVGLA